MYRDACYSAFIPSYETRFAPVHLLSFVQKSDNSMKMSVQIGTKHCYPLWYREEDSTANKRPSDCKIQWHEVKYPEQRSKFKTDARNCDCAEVTRSRFCVILLRDDLTEDFAGEQLFQNGNSRVRVFHHAVFHPIEQHTGHSRCIKP